MNNDKIDKKERYKRRTMMSNTVQKHVEEGEPPSYNLKIFRYIHTFLSMSESGALYDIRSNI